MRSLIPVDAMRWLSAAISIMLMTVTTPVAALAGDPPACEIPADLAAPSEPMPAVAAALAAGRPVEILALGSGSTVGETGTSSGPALAVKTPAASSSDFHLTVMGGRNVTAEAMLQTLRKSFSEHRYDLVLWQTGTVEAVRGLRPDTLYNVLEDGMAAAAEAKADLVLVDPQFSRFLRANTDIGPYEAVLEQVAGQSGVSLFHRFDLTQLWVTNGEVDLERVSPEKRDATVALLNNCLGQALARYVLTGAGEP
jgi:hypothetical protein